MELPAELQCDNSQSPSFSEAKCHVPVIGEVLAFPGGCLSLLQLGPVPGFHPGSSRGADTVQLCIPWPHPCRG